ncbi:MAG: hypothetical protein QOH67_3254 [Hyphomicrobiales bacterium]|jgi:hypothetical protein|nr:hypothetical protein [Hyphomicrobiales bacterium]
MPNFSVTPTSPASFEGEFQIAPVGDYPWGQHEDSYVAAVHRALALMAKDEGRDANADIPDTLRNARRATRKAIAAELQADAFKLVNAEAAPEELEASAGKLEAKYRTTVPKFGIRDKVGSTYDEFELVRVPDYAPTEGETTLLVALGALFKEFADDERAEQGGKFAPGVIDLRKSYRKITASAVKAALDEFWQGKSTAAVATEALFVAKGKYQAWRNRLNLKLFRVGLIKGDQDKQPNELAVDLEILLTDGLPPPEDTASPEKRELFLQINKAHTVIRTVCQRVLDAPEKWGAKADNEASQQAIRDRVRRVRDQYLANLAGVAVIGLEDSHTAVATLALNELKAEFAAGEGARIKRKYARWLALWAFLASAALAALYIMIIVCPAMHWGNLHKPFLLAGIGAALGAWLSFSIRQVEFVFEDLLQLDYDAFDPPLRIAFVIVLTWTAFLLFWTGAINVEIGALSTKAAALKLAGSISLLIGLFCGLSERALATAITGRAASFVKGVAGP